MFFFFFFFILKKKNSHSTPLSGNTICLGEVWQYHDSGKTGPHLLDGIKVCMNTVSVVYEIVFHVRKCNMKAYCVLPPAECYYIVDKTWHLQWGGQRDHKNNISYITEHKKNNMKIKDDNEKYKLLSRRFDSTQYIINITDHKNNNMKVMDHKEKNPVFFVLHDINMSLIPCERYCSINHNSHMQQLFRYKSKIYV